MIKKSFVIVTTVLVSAFVTYGISKSMKNSNTELSELTLANVEALAQYEGNFNGQEWDSDDHWYNDFGGDFTPDLRECTYNSGSWGINIDIKPGGIGGGVSYQSPITSTQGSRIVCIHGNGNCFNGTDCI